MPVMDQAYFARVWLARVLCQAHVVGVPISGPPRVSSSDSARGVSVVLKEKVQKLGKMSETVWLRLVGCRSNP